MRLKNLVPKPGEFSLKIGVNLILRISGILVAYLNILIISSFYGVESYGIFTICFTIISIAQVVPLFGLQTSIIRLLSDFSEHENKEKGVIILKALSLTFCLAIVFSLLLFFSSELLSDLLNKPNMEDEIRTISFVILPISIIALFSGIFQALDASKRYMILKTLVVQSIFLLLLLTNNLAKIDRGVIELYLLSVIIGLIISTVMITIKLKKSNILLTLSKVNNSLTSFKTIIKTSFPMLLATSVFLIMGWTDILMLSYFENEINVGVFNASLKISTFIGISLVAVNSIVTQRFANLFVLGKIEELKNLVKKSTKFIFFLSMPIAFSFIILPKFFLSFLGEGFMNGYKVLVILSIGQLVNALCGSVGFLMQMTNHQKTHQNIILLSSAINAILNFVLIPRHGIIGAAIANSTSLFLWNFLMVLSIKRNLGFWTFYLPFININKYDNSL